MGEPSCRTHTVAAAADTCHPPLRGSPVTRTGRDRRKSTHSCNKTRYPPPAFGCAPNPPNPWRTTLCWRSKSSPVTPYLALNGSTLSASLPHSQTSHITRHKALLFLPPPTQQAALVRRLAPSGRRSSSTLVALGKNARMIRPARVSCGPSAANGLPLIPSASARTN